MRGGGGGQLISDWSKDARWRMESRSSDWTIIQDGNSACDWTRIQDGGWKSSHLIGQ